MSPPFFGGVEDMFIRVACRPRDLLRGTVCAGLCSVIRWHPRHWEMLRWLGGRVCNHGVTGVSNGWKRLAACRGECRLTYDVVRLAVQDEARRGSAGWAQGSARAGEGAKCRVRELGRVTWMLQTQLEAGRVDGTGSLTWPRGRPWICPQDGCWRVGGGRCHCRWRPCTTSTRAATVLWAWRWDRMQAQEG